MTVTARDYLDTGIANLGLLGGPKNLAAAREAFRQATELDPGMCDAWLGLAAAGDTGTPTLRKAHDTSTTLHRETRRLGLGDADLAPTVPAPVFLDLYPHTPRGLALAYAAGLIRDGDYAAAEKLLDHIDLNREPQQTQIYRFLGATLHYVTRRWPDVLTWTSRPVSAHNEVVDAATILLRGIAHTGLGQFQTALATLENITTELHPAPIAAEAALYRGLCHRALHEEQTAHAQFAAATVDGVLRPDAAAALADPTFGPIVTTEEAIVARTDRWDPDSGPTTTEIHQAQQLKAAQDVLDEAQHSLDAFIGLQRVKVHVTELKNVQIYDQAMAQRGVEVGRRESLHMTVVGPAGTGKTSIARIICQMYFGLGILESPEFIEVSRNELVGQHIGETEAKTSAILNNAKGRALLIDEAPDLYKPDLDRDFGRIALDTIMKFAEDHRHDTMIALAGYAAPMDQLLSANPGLRSRFPYQLEFVSNTADEIVQIAQLFATTSRVTIDPQALQHFTSITEWLCNTPVNDEQNQLLIDIAANGRYARNVIASATGKMKARNAADPDIDLLTADIDAISVITVADMQTAITEVLTANDLTASPELA
ncbi:MAG: AAA family ATPase [Mycobacterium sp.]